MPPGNKDRWDKADILLKPLGGLLTALAVAVVGYWGSLYLEQRQQEDARTRLYAELMSRREEADSGIRKDMFNTVIATFLTPEKTSKDYNSNASPKSESDAKAIEDKILALELLAYNFHDAMDMSPLFKDVYARIKTLPKRDQYRSRLESTAKEVASKQIAALEEAGVKVVKNIDFHDLRKRPEGIRVLFESLEREGVLEKRDFEVNAIWVDDTNREINLILDVRSPGESTKNDEQLHSVFWLGFFDFPIVDNTRLSNGDRCAITLNKFTQSSAEITLIYFPGSRASLKDKPYYDEIIDLILPTNSKSS